MPAVRNGVPGSGTTIAAATSQCGLWLYERLEDSSTSWAVRYLPTGQISDVHSSLARARVATASWLLPTLVAAALKATHDVDNAVIRERGQRWLAIHTRIAGADQTEYRCTCGGLLITLAGGSLGHVDACDNCTTYGTPGIQTGCETAHRFCADPAPAGCAHDCGRDATPNRGAGCGLAHDTDCCQGCCHGE
jgi:hypothetical protein